MDCGASKSSEDDGHGHGHRGGGGGPCGACKFLRRKCVKGCVFAPYFDSEGGTAQFAAVHKVFGASNASKLLLRIPPHKRLDAVLTLCYEALARARDPVYGCVAHIFALQHQVVNLQAELAHVQARLSTLQRLPPVPPSLPQPQTSSSSSPSHALPYSNPHDFPIDPLLHQPHPTSLDFATFFNPNSDQQHAGDLQSLARELVSRYLPGVKVKPSSSH